MAGFFVFKFEEVGSSITNTGLKKATKARSLQVIKITYFKNLVSLRLGGLK